MHDSTNEMKFIAGYDQHLETLQRRCEQAMEACGYQAMIVSAGAPSCYFIDDRPIPFQPNPHFRHWFPMQDCAGSHLLTMPSAAPRLFFLQPNDYWHRPPDTPTGSWTEFVDVQVFASTDCLHQALAAAVRTCSGIAIITPNDAVPEGLSADRNPKKLINWLHHERARKNSYELDCLRQAQKLAARGHMEAETAWRNGACEFEVHMAYLEALRCPDMELPYQSIVATNANAAILHYQHLCREKIPESARRSLLIDAGAAFRGYAADISRTHAYRDDDHIAELIVDLDCRQRDIIASIHPGQDFLDLHMQAHAQIAELLENQDLVRLSPEKQLEAHITRFFFPHGLGHFLGLQVHDVGGWQRDHAGNQQPPPKSHQSLRLTRELEIDQVLTIEPGIYFIPMLLNELRNTRAAGRINWRKIETLLDAGGIRIEDNIRIRENGCENLTRDAFATLSA